MRSVLRWRCRLQVHAAAYPMEKLNTHMAPGRAITLWITYVVLFNLAGGVAAGVLALVFQLIGVDFTEVLYAAVYAVTGFMAYLLGRNVLEGR